MSEKPQRVAPLGNGFLPIREPCGEMPDRPENVAFLRMPVVLQTCAVGNVHVVPGSRMLPLGFAPDPVRPEAQFVQALALPQVLDFLRCLRAEVFLGNLAGDSMPVGAKAVRVAECRKRRERRNRQPSEQISCLHQRYDNTKRPDTCEGAQGRECSQLLRTVSCRRGLPGSMNRVPTKKGPCGPFSSQIPSLVRS